MESRSRRPLRPHASRGPQRARPLRRQTLRPDHGQAPAPPAPARAAQPLVLLRLTRHGIPALIVLAGIVAMCFGTETSLVGGAGLIGAGAASWLVGWLYRLGVAGDAERGHEERARAQFERTGRWPEP
jgi:hypothetical protein